MKQTVQSFRLVPSTFGSWMLGLLVGIAVGVATSWGQPAQLLEVIPLHLLAWPTPILHGVAGALITVVVWSLICYPFQRRALPRNEEARRAYVQNCLHHCGEQFGRRSVADDHAQALTRLAELARARISDHWSLIALAGFLLGFGWLTLFLSMNVLNLTAATEARATLFVGFAEAAVVLCGAALLWFLWRRRLRSWEGNVRRAVIYEATLAQPTATTPKPEAAPMVAEAQVVAPTPPPPLQVPAAGSRPRPTGPLPMGDD